MKNSPRNYVFQCSCHDFHFLTLTWYPDDKYVPDLDVEAEIAFGGDYHHNWRARGKAVWNVLRGRSAHAMYLNLDYDHAVAFRDALNDYIEDARGDV